MLNTVTISDIREEFRELYSNEQFVIDKTGMKTVEIINACFVADEESIFGQVNKEWIERELAWYESQSLNVNDIPGGAPIIWKKCGTQEGLINSNYGYLVFSEENGNQFNSVVNTLLNHEDSRRAEMIYTRPSMQTDYCEGGRSDFCCTETVQYIIRDNKLHTIVKMRSGDAVYGYLNDRRWQVHVLDKLLHELNSRGHSYEVGTLYWNVGSLHIYARHFKLIDHFIKTGEIISQ